MWWKVRTGLCLVALLASGALLASCGSSTSADSLTGTNWELEELNNRDVLDNVSVTMLLDTDDDLSGSAGCNRYVGRWEVDKGHGITLEPGGTTMMACDGSIMEQEQTFLTVLAEAERFDLHFDELELYNAEGKRTAEFERLRPADLTSTSWEATALNNGQQGVVTILEGTTITAYFEIEDDRLSGGAGCNTYTTSYERDGDEITIETPALSLMACDGPVMDQETLYLQALTQAATYELGHETLYLRDGEGALLVAFKEAD